MLKPFAKFKLPIGYAAAMAGLLLALKLLQYRYLIIEQAYNIYIICLATLFSVVGIWVSAKLTRPKTRIVEKTTYVLDNHSIPDLSRREL